MDSWRLDPATGLLYVPVATSLRTARMNIGPATICSPTPSRCATHAIVAGERRLSADGWKTITDRCCYRWSTRQPKTRQRPHRSGEAQP